jgi:uncharacterized repeat protein (TIGR01451 family)
VRRRWDAALGAGLLCGLAGLLFGSATLVAAGVVGTTYAAYGAAVGSPGGPVVVRREVSDRQPPPGSRVTVTVELENVGDDPVAEARVVDAPPSELPVVSGSPAHATSLDAGETEVFEYALRATRGSHEFGPARLLVRNVAGSAEREETFPVETPVACRTPVEELPLAGQTTQYDGRVVTDAAGEGIAFHSTREFHPADPLSRIDWKRYARTNELTTVSFQETRAATVVLLVDVRPESGVAAGPGEPTGTDFSAYAAGHLGGVLLGASNRVGAALLGRWAYLSPGTGRDQALCIRQFLSDVVDVDATDEDGQSSVLDVDVGVFGGSATAAGSGATPDGGGATTDGGAPPHRRAAGAASPDSRADGGGYWLRRLRKRLPDHAQVVFCSPALDGGAVETARLLGAHGHAVTVVSPDVTTDDTPGGTVARLDRAERLESLRSHVRVVDWSPDEPLAVAVDRAGRRWSR